MTTVYKKIFFSFFLSFIVLYDSSFAASKDTKDSIHYDAIEIIKQIKKSDEDSYETKDKKLVIIGPLIKEVKNGNEEVIKKLKAEIGNINKIEEESPDLVNNWTIEYFPEEKDQPVAASLSEGL